MDVAGFELVPVAAGGHSVRSKGVGETFHPVVGPMHEARELHAGQHRLVDRARQHDPLVIWDVGLGAAANSIAAIEALAGVGSRIRMHSFDHSTAAVEFALAHAAELGYPAGHEALLAELITKQRATAGSMEWRLHLGDFRLALENPAIESPHAIFYDPYSPAVNADMWTLDHLGRLFGRLGEPCLLTNYTRSTAVRVTLLLAGFFVGRGCPMGAKEETTVAANVPWLIERPLDHDWLSRVARSSNSAPLREGRPASSPISAEDLQALKAHAQFACSRRL